MILPIAIFDNLGTTELLIVAVVALLLFGKRLPEVASQAGATLARFRRSLDSAIHDSGVEQEIRKIKSAMPTDMSVRDVTRAAVRKFEDRMREEIDPVTGAVMSITAPPPSEPATGTPSSAVQAPGSPAPETQVASIPAAKPGVDPASQFGQSSANEAHTPDPNHTGQNGVERNGATPSSARPNTSEEAPSSNASASTEAESTAAERARQSRIPPRPLPPGSVPRD